MTRWSRREALRAAAMGVVAGAAAGCTSDDSAPAPTGSAPWTVERWLTERGGFFQIAHRGCGDVVPEHTLEAYRQAVAWGATAVEISVHATSDGALVCHHDDTLDRTTTLTGRVSAHTAAELAAGRVDIPRLGPRWRGERAPRIPLLRDVLAAIGHRAVLCIEAKADPAYEPMVAMLKGAGLADSTVIKVHRASPRLAEAGRAGFARFAYLGSMAETSGRSIRELAARLDRERDLIVMPTGGEASLPAPLVRAALATKVPTALFPVHRRWEVEHARQAGLAGVVSSSIGYTSGAVPAVRRDEWGSGGLSPGQLTRDPASDAYAVGWPEAGVVSLAARGQQAFVTLGDLGPLPDRGPRHVSMEVRVAELPGPHTNLTLAFGHADDRYYEHRQGIQAGYHAIIRMSGEMELLRHTPGSPEGTRLARATSPALQVGSWVRVTLDITGRQIAFTRTDTGSACSAVVPSDPRGYLHVGRSAPVGAIWVRNVRVS